MKNCKRMAAFLLALMLIAGILPLSAGAANLPALKVPEVNAVDLKPISALIPADTTILAESQTEQSQALKVDISGASVTVLDDVFLGVPIEPEPIVRVNRKTLTAGTDYVVIYENNINIGTATARIIGIGDYYGTITANFDITTGDGGRILDGTYNGNAEDELNDEVYYDEALVPPGYFQFNINSAAYHIAYYELYQVQGEDPVLIASCETEYARDDQTSFEYDFSDVYDRQSENGYEIYLLAYTWMDQFYDVYSGVFAMYISNKVPEATAMSMGQVTDDGDFRREYLAVFGDDGVLDDVTWISSNESVATIADGVMTLKAPGTVTITAAAGDLTASHEFTVEALDLADAEIVSPTSVVYGRQELVERTDYTTTSTTAGGVVDVSITGRGLFTGHALRQFDEATGEALGHTHTFDHGCDASCNTCEFTRDTDHQYGTSWTKDMDAHWHACSVCGHKADYAEHTLSPDDDTLCTVCGTLYIPGDLDQDFTVDEDDAIYLLQHVLLPDYFPVEQAVDYTGDGQINEDDAIYLLQHVLLPDYFPLG